WPPHYWEKHDFPFRRSRNLRNYDPHIAATQVIQNRCRYGEGVDRNQSPATALQVKPVNPCSEPCTHPLIFPLIAVSAPSPPPPKPSPRTARPWARCRWPAAARRFGFSPLSPSSPLLPPSP